MTIYRWTIAALWLTLAIYWAIAGTKAKRSIGTTGWWSRESGRLGVIGIVVALWGIPPLRHALRSTQAHLAGSAILGFTGASLCAMGIGFAIIARAYLGRNWGMPMTRKECPELVTTGPYAWVRHPIYSGLILAMLGSTLGQSVFWTVPLLSFSAYFIHSARREERLMLEQFPQQYPAYAARTKMLLPWVL